MGNRAFKDDAPHTSQNLPCESDGATKGCSERTKVHRFADETSIADVSLEPINQADIEQHESRLAPETIADYHIKRNPNRIKKGLCKILPFPQEKMLKRPWRNDNLEDKLTDFIRTLAVDVQDNINAMEETNLYIRGKLESITKQQADLRHKHAKSRHIMDEIIAGGREIDRWIETAEAK